MNKWILGLTGLVTGYAVAELGGALYLYKRTMLRQKTNAGTKRTMKMAGTDWSVYQPVIQQRKQNMLEQNHRDVYVKSDDGLRLHATYFPRGDEKKVVICFHGYTSKGMTDYIALSDFYMRKGYSMLLIDARAHGESEGKYVGFGCLDRMDALHWINWIIDNFGENVQILLHGTSMGGATVLMCTGLHLPRQVKGVVADCAFTSPKEVFSHVLRHMYHLPVTPMIQISGFINRKLAGYGWDECNAAREVKKAQIPGLMFHGMADGFVPASMCDEIYHNYAAEKRRLVVPGAAHAESYYKDMEQYESVLEEWMEDVIK